MSDQNPAFGWFYGRWRKVYERIDKHRVVGSVRWLAQQNPGVSRERLAGLIVRRSARLAAAAGVVTTAPALLPGIGLAIAVAGIVPEEVYTMRRKCFMLLQLAAAYGFDPAEDERLVEILALVGDVPRSLATLMTAKDDISRMSVRVLASSSRQLARPAGVGVRVATRGVVRYLPVVGLLAGGGMNYYGFSVLGRRAARFYRKRRRVHEPPPLLPEAEA